MDIITNFHNNIIPDKYGSNDTYRHRSNYLSFPFQVHGLPQDSKFLAVTLIDYDTVPFIGFAWIHWVMLNVPVDGENIVIPENISASDQFPQGLNSLHSILNYLRDPLWRFRKDRGWYEQHYAGPRPRNGIHRYRLTVYALSGPTSLQEKFNLGDLMGELDDLLIDQASINLKYERKF